MRCQSVKRKYFYFIIYFIARYHFIAEHMTTGCSNWNWYGWSIQFTSTIHRRAQRVKKICSNFLQFNKHKATNEWKRFRYSKPLLSHFECKLNKFISGWIMLFKCIVEICAQNVMTLANELLCFLHINSIIIEINYSAPRFGGLSPVLLASTTRMCLKPESDWFMMQPQKM